MVVKERVCVTGAGGYQASWLVSLLLSQGYLVHGTVRNPSDEKNAHLKKLGRASENLQLFKADLLDYNGFYAAFKGCTGVFHVASPCPPDNVPNPEVELMEPAVKGTANILKACSSADVKKLVVVSSAGAVLLNPNWPKEQAMDESSWTDEEYCKKLEWSQNWYCLAKTVAEKQALEYGMTSGLKVATVCPSLIIGPMLQSSINSSSLFLLGILKGGAETVQDTFRWMVDVRDVAEALLLVYQNPEAEGRYICSSYTVPLQDIVDTLKRNYPNYDYPKQITAFEEYAKLSSEKLKSLGWKYRPLEEALVDSVKDYQEKGILAEV